MIYKIGLFFAFLTCIYSHQLHASDYKYIQRPHIGGDIGKNLTIVDNRLYVLSKSEWYVLGSYLDIYQLDTAEPAKHRRRIQLNNETRRIAVSKDLILLEHLDSVSVMRITETSAQLIGTIKASYTRNFHATLHNNMMVIRNGFNAGATDIEIYDVGDQISLRKKLIYDSGGMSGQLQMDSDSIYLCSGTLNLAT